MYEFSQMTLVKVLIKKKKSFCSNILWNPSKSYLSFGFSPQRLKSGWLCNLEKLRDTSFLKEIMRNCPFRKKSYHQMPWGKQIATTGKEISSIKWTKRDFKILHLWHLLIGYMAEMFSAQFSVSFIVFVIRSASLLLLLSCQVVCDSLQPHGLQPARLSCPSLSPWVCSNSRPLNCFILTRELRIHLRNRQKIWSTSSLISLLCFSLARSHSLEGNELLSN